MSLFQMAFDYAAPVLYVDMNGLPTDPQVSGAN